MIEAAMIWNEPNNKSHWDPEIDPDWSRFAHMAKLAANAIREVNPGLTRVLGGISPIDPNFLALMKSQGVLDHLDAVAAHGFPLDWNLWQIHEWPQKLEELRSVTELPVWVSEVGVSTFGAEEVQLWGLKKTAELLKGRAERIQWYSLYDLPR
ncbi:beta-xylosidase, partial [Sinorhizobium medicae]